MKITTRQAIDNTIYNVKSAGDKPNVFAKRFAIIQKSPKFNSIRLYHCEKNFTIKFAV
jgi:hypothetical protein